MFLRFDEQNRFGEKKKCFPGLRKLPIHVALPDETIYCSQTNDCF